jgi:glucuronoarabinoxylan endo-1,4-beta-xylanase
MLAPGSCCCRVWWALAGLCSFVLLTDCRRLSEPVEIVLDPAERHQNFEGFGTSINSWSPNLAGYFDRPEFRRFYLEELGASVLRVDLHGQVVPERERAEEISYQDYLLEGAGARGAVYLRAAEALTRDSGGRLRVIASVWSPPAWMKQNASLGNGHGGRKNFGLSDAELGVSSGPEGGPRDGGTEDERRRFLFSNKLRPDRYEHFARSLVEWVRLYRAHGVELYGLSPQNEPRFSHWFGSCVYTPAELAEVTRSIVETFAVEKEKLPRLFVPETMTHDIVGNRAYLAALLDKPELRSAIHALAVHGYVDGYEADSDPKSPGRFLDLATPFGRAIWYTEGGTGGHDWPKPLDGLGMLLVHAVREGNASLIVPWQFVDAQPSEHALTVLTGPTKKTSVARHFARAFQPGMRRVGASVAGGALDVVAFEHRARSELTVVVLNRAAKPVPVALTVRGRLTRAIPREILITSQQQTLARVEGAPSPVTSLPARSIATFLVPLGS